MLFPRAVAGVPTGGVHDQRVGPIRRDCEERRAARRQQPLVATADRVGEIGGAYREPAGRLGDVEQHRGAGSCGRRAQRVQVGDPTIGGLHGQYRDQAGLLRHRGRELGRRYLADADVAARLGQEREQHAGEVASRGEHLTAVR